MDINSLNATSIEHIVLALNSISGSPPTFNQSSQRKYELIKESESALLGWEKSNPNIFAMALISIMLSPDVGPNVPPRIAALLTLKALVSRKWKDRGRRKVTKSNDLMLDEETKEKIRNTILFIVTNGGSYHGLPRETCLSLIYDKSFQKCAASVISKIGRLDLPLKYQTLVPSLVEFSTGNNEIFPTITDQKLVIAMRVNSSTALAEVLSEICQKRLLLDKKYVISIAHTHLASLVINGFSYALQCLKNGFSDTTEDYRILYLDYATIMARIIHHLLLSALPNLIVGTSKDANDNFSIETPAGAIDKLFMLILECIPAMVIQLRQNEGKNDDSFHDSLNVLLKQLCDIIVTAQKEHAIAFGRFIEPYLHLFYNDLIHFSHTNSPDAFLMSSVLFLANVAGCSDYVPDEQSNISMEALRDNPGSDYLERSITSKGDVSINGSKIRDVLHVVWIKFFTPERIMTLTEFSLRHLMPLTEERLSAWNDDPESYFIEDSNRIVECDLATCGQHLYVSLFESKAGKQIVSTLITNYLNDTEAQRTACEIEAGLKITYSQVPVFGDQSILLWDAIYTAVGLSSDIFTHDTNFDFLSWFSCCIIPCLKNIIQGQNKDSNIMPILRRRIIWLIRCLYHQKNQDRCVLYEILVSVLREVCSIHNDLNVKLEAVEALISLLYDPDASINKLLNCSDVLIPTLYELASQCNEFDSRFKCISTVTLLLNTVVGTGQKINSCLANVVVNPLKIIWENSTDQNLQLRSEVMSILSCMASSVVIEEVEKLHQIALPMIDVVLDPKSQYDLFFLVEDALKLWLTLLRLSKDYGPNFEMMFVRAKDLIDEDLEHLKLLMLLTEGYILRSSKTFLDAHSSNLQHILQLVVGQVKPRGAFYVHLVVEGLLRKYPIDGGNLLLQGGIVELMIKSCATHSAQTKTCEPDRVIMLYLNSFSRILLSSPNVFDNGLLPFVFDEEGRTMTFEYKDLVHLMMKLFEYAGNYEFGILFQRLWVLFLLFCIPPSPVHHLLQEVVLKNFDSLLTMCLLVIKKQSFALNPYCLGYDEEEETFDIGLQMYEHYLKNDFDKDIGFVSNISSIFKIKIEGLKTAIDECIYKEIFDTVEPSTLQQLEVCLGSNE